MTSAFFPADPGTHGTAFPSEPTLWKTLAIASLMALVLCYASRECPRIGAIK